LTEREILSAQSSFDWLLLWLKGATNSADWSSAKEGKTKLLRWRTHSAEELRSPENFQQQPGQTEEVMGELDEPGLLKLRERMLWRYPFSDATVEPALKRVSGLIWERGGAADDGMQLLFKEPPALPAQRTRAAKRAVTGMAAVDVGSAHHQFLEMVPLEKVNGLDALKAAAAQMLKSGSLLAEEVEALDLAAVLRFWQSETGQMILAQVSSVHREIPFTARFSSEDLAGAGLGAQGVTLQGEYYVVRGKADLAVILPSEIWLLDFKTDQVTGAELQGKIGLYAPQLKLYALALSRIYGRPATRRWLHFLGPGKTVSV
jgi:ATP-dependent helicase/nuclease subunit A